MALIVYLTSPSHHLSTKEARQIAGYDDDDSEDDNKDDDEEVSTSLLSTGEYKCPLGGCDNPDRLFTKKSNLRRHLLSNQHKCLVEKVSRLLGPDRKLGLQKGARPGSEKFGLKHIGKLVLTSKIRRRAVAEGRNRCARSRVTSYSHDLKAGGFAIARARFRAAFLFQFEHTLPNSYSLPQTFSESNASTPGICILVDSFYSMWYMALAELLTNDIWLDHHFVQNRSLTEM